MKGFTLIELLVVIAILAILAVVVVVVINPAELLKQSRDSTRLSDLSSLQSAIALYLADYQTTTWSSGVFCTFGTTRPGGSAGCTTNSSTAVNGTGWVNGIYLNEISSGAPLSKLPLDPVNDANYYYAFSKGGNFGEYKIYARLESKRYYPQQSNDGGVFNNCPNTTTPTPTANCWYEIGSNMTLNP